MTSWTYLTRDQVITARPCLVLSVTITTQADGPGEIVLYDERSAVAGQELAHLLCPSGQTVQFRWYGLRTQRGLYVDIVALADYVTVEWEPLAEEAE